MPVSLMSISFSVPTFQKAGGIEFWQQGSVGNFVDGAVSKMNRLIKNKTVLRIETFHLAVYFFRKKKTVRHNRVYTCRER